MEPVFAASMTSSLTDTDLVFINDIGLRQCFAPGQVIFSEGDPADSFHYIEDGSVAVTIDKNGVTERIATLCRGDYFGEMAILSTDRRTATVTAVDSTTVQSVDKDKFLEIVQQHPEVAQKIYHKISLRNEELSLKEQLLDSMGIGADSLHVSIKGDPSLRETTFTRERYTSVVDPILPQLQSCMEELLLNRCVHRMYVGFNNGEVRTSSVFDPFSTEIHIAQKLVDPAYLDRHFPKLAYEQKSELIRRLYQFIGVDHVFTSLPDNWQHVFAVSHQAWQPIPKEKISNVISKLTDLRAIPNFYVRNVHISIVQDAIRMQFNCDGTHIVDATNYQRFLDENLEVCPAEVE